MDNLDNEEETIYSPQEIYEQVVAFSEVILTIPALEEERLKNSLSSAKSKMQAKLKAEGQAVDTSQVLTFDTTPAEEEGYIDIRISLVKKSGIRVKKITLPDPEF